MVNSFHLTIGDPKTGIKGKVCGLDIDAAWREAYLCIANLNPQHPVAFRVFGGGDERADTFDPLNPRTAH